MPDSVTDETANKTVTTLVFRAGKYPQGEVTPADLRQLARNYDPSWLEAPITVDHEKKGPAYGWVKSLKAKGNELFAELELDEMFEYEVRSGRYKKRSVEILRSFELPNGKSAPYLRAVSFLGANSPHVSGMPDIEFSGDYTVEEFCMDPECLDAPKFSQSEETPMPAVKTDTSQEELQKQLEELSQKLKAKEEEAKAATANFEQSQQRIQEFSAKVETLEADFRSSEERTRKAEEAAFSAQLEARLKTTINNAVSEGRPVKPLEALFSFVAENLPRDCKDTIEFSQKQLTPLDALFEIIEKTPKAVDPGASPTIGAGSNPPATFSKEDNPKEFALAHKNEMDRLLKENPDMPHMEAYSLASRNIQTPTAQ